MHEIPPCCRTYGGPCSAVEEWKGAMIVSVLVCLFRDKNPLNLSLFHTAPSYQYINMRPVCTNIFLAGTLLRFRGFLARNRCKEHGHMQFHVVLSSSRDENEKCSLRADVCACVVQLLVSLHIVNRQDAPRTLGACRSIRLTRYAVRRSDMWRSVFLLTWFD